MRLAAYLDSPRKIILWASAFAFVIWFAFSLAFSGAIHSAEEMSGDWVWRTTASAAAEQRIVLVDIDEASLRHFGSWPWSRARLAELSDKLSGQGATLQIFDIVFPEATGEDDQFVASLKKNNAILSQVFALQANTQARSGVPTSPLPWPGCPATFPVAENYIANAAAFKALPVGHITPLVDHDGSVRHQPAVICHDGKPFPALFLAAIMKGTATTQINFVASEGFFAAPWELTGLPLYKNGVPLDHLGNVRVPWQLKPEAFIAISAEDILNGQVPQGLLNNAWVLVGSTALGLNDRVATPFSGIEAGMLVHAQLLRGVLDESIPFTPRFAEAYAALAAMVCALMLAALARLRRKSVFILVGAALVLTAALYLTKALLLVKGNIWLGWVHPSLYILCFSLAVSLLEHARSRMERDRIFAHLSSYLPGPVAAALAARDPSDAIEASRKNITALFADIRNFSAYCEARPPEETTAVLHAFFSMATEIVERHGGMVESFQGDAILAVWGATNKIDAPGLAEGASGDEAGADPERALSAAIEMLMGSRRILTSTPEGLQPLELGLGLETGVATVGSFGLARRRTHLAMGRTITTAARLEQMTAELAHPILVGEGMAACISDRQLESQGVFLLEGMKTPCHIYAYPLENCV